MVFAPTFVFNSRYNYRYKRKEEMKDLNKLAKEIHEANKAKGFHEEKHSTKHMMCLVISELMEAVEADRKNRQADLKTFEELMSGVEDKHYDIMYAKCFKAFIKDTTPDELADAVIRLLDTTGALGLYLCVPEKVNTGSGRNTSLLENSSFTEIIYTICGVIYSYKMSIETRIRVMIGAIVEYCEYLGIDIWKHVELKLKYNSLRPYKHGKQY